MLSVRYRDEDRGLEKNRRTKLGFVGADKMEENELEEGEACSYRDEDSDVRNPDVDVDLSYIDKKIRDVLGHFQKDFEGGVSAENLGAKFGGYGSFLQPTRSPPIVSHSGSSVRVQHPVLQCRGDQPFAQSQGARQNSSHQPIASVPTRSTQALVSAQITTSAASLDASVGKEIQTHSTSCCAGESSPKGDSAVKPSSFNAKKSLKVRLKVPPCHSSRNNAAIYSGLGLDISPSSSLEESSGYSGGLSPEAQEAPDESPTTILQFMTSSPICGVSLLSPLSDSLLQLMEKRNPPQRNTKSRSGQKGSFDAALVHDALPGKDFTVQKMKTTRVVENPQNLSEINHLNATVEEKGFPAFLKKEIEIDAPDGHTLKLSLPAKTKEKGKTTKAVGKLGKPSELQHMNATIEEMCSPFTVKKEMIVETPEGKELVLETLMPSLPGRKDNSLDKLDMQSAGDARKNTYKLSDLFGEEEDTVTPESISLSDNVKVETKETTSAPRSDKADKAEDNSVPMKATVTLNANLAEKTWLDQEFLDKDDTELSKDTNSKADAKSNASGEFVQGKKNKNESPEKIVKSKVACEIGERKGQEEKDNLFSGKLRLNDGQGTTRSTSESSKERSKSGSSASHKHKRKGMNMRVDVLEAQPDLMRLQESNKRADKDYHNDPTRYVKTEHDKSRSTLDLSDSCIKDRPISNSGHNEIEPSGLWGKQIEKLDRKRSQDASAYELNGEVGTDATVPANGLVSETTTVAASVLITENWVCCDKCQKWRLHPYGPDPTCLPKKWVCRMQSWLPWLNKCIISQEKGIKAFYALYQIQDHQNGLHNHNGGAVPVTSLAGGQNLEPNFLLSGFVSGAGEKHLPKEAQNDSSFLVAAPLPNSTKNLQAFAKGGSLNDVNHYPLDSNLLDKDGLRHVDKAQGHVKEKRKHKHHGKLKSLGSYSDGGESIDQDMNSKSKSKRELLQNSHKASKKVKVDRSLHKDEEQNLKDELTGGTSNGTKLDDQNALKHNEHYSPSKDSKCGNIESDNNLGRMLKDRDQSSFHGESKVKSGTLGLEKLDKDEISTKKRKMKQWQQNQELAAEGSDGKWYCSDVIAPKRTVIHETGHRKEKKAKSSNCERRESSTSNEKMDKKGAAMRIVPYSGGDLVLDGADDECGGMHEKEQKGGTLPGNSVSRRISEGSNPLKLEAGCTQHSAAATSSSSKVSGSHKTKVKLHEVKGSPVESVSSSPLRMTNGDKVARRKIFLGKDDLVNESHTTGSNLRRCLDGEIDGVRKFKNTFAVQRGMQDDDRVNKSSLDAHRKKYDDQNVHRKKLNPVIAPNSDGATNSNFSVEFENNHVANGTGEPEWPNQFVSGLKNKENGLKRKKYDARDVSVHVKSTKATISLSKDKQWANKSEPGKDKSKVHDFFDENSEVYSTKNGEEIGINTHGKSPSHKAKRAIVHCKGSSNSDKDFKNDIEINVKCSGKKRRDIQLIAKNPDKSDTEGFPSAKQQVCSMVGNPEAAHGKDEKSGLHSNPQELITGEEEKFLTQNLSNRTNETVLVSARGNVQSFPSSGSKQQGQRTTLSSHVGNKLEAVDVSNGDASKLLKQSRQPEDTNVAVNGGLLRQSAANGVVNKEPDAVRNILKEATNVKHSADRLRGGGQELESIALYFSAALKFLHAASLLEPSDAEVAKQGDNPSMKVYVDTAKLCEFCAHMYEKHKDMASAALAYKCMEVAFMRVIFLKHTYANRVRQELQALVPNIIGESPSSSASDVDNLINTGMSERPRQVQGVGSPQIPTSLVISGGNRHSFDWLLNFANDVTSAMDALKRSQNAFAAATGSLENAQYRFEGISSVRRVIEFNFHDVEGLLRLVRLSMEEISH